MRCQEPGTPGEPDGEGDRRRGVHTEPGVTGGLHRLVPPVGIERP
jgi:hypothetical protein